MGFSREDSENVKEEMPVEGETSCHGLVDEGDNFRRLKNNFKAIQFT